MSDFSSTEFTVLDRSEVDALRCKADQAEILADELQRLLNSIIHENSQYFIAQRALYVYREAVK